ncbi:MAG: TonB-dependent receptor plug domain-containing protein [Thermodesulfovibrionales bacterium]
MIKGLSGLFSAFVFLSVLGSSVFASSQTEESFLLMYFYEDDVVVTPTRFPKPLSQVAENITVVTAQQIEMMNAHTLSDVVNTVAGVGHDTLTFPGGTFFASIQGSKYEHVRVIMDGVTLNNLVEGWAYLAEIPVQNIERIEIIKGPASSSWGSSLGGIINIITKSGGPAKPDGLVTTSLGERRTTDTRAEISGSAGKFSYYATGGNLGSNGLGPKTWLQDNNLYLKLGYELTERLSLQFSSWYIRTEAFDLKYFPPDLRQHYNVETVFFALSGTYLIDSNSEVNISVREKRHHTFNAYRTLDETLEFGAGVNHEKTDGASLRISSRTGVHAITAGFDYDRGYDETGSSAASPFSRQTFTQSAVYINDTVALGRVAVTPGVRYDSLRNQDLLDPSLGITVRLTDRTLLRFVAARGFNVPALGTALTRGGYTGNPDLKSERIRSFETGIETSDIKYVRVKGSLFSHRISDAFEYSLLPDGNYTYVNKSRVKRDGFEIEVRTVPIHKFSFSAGVCMVKARDQVTGEKLLGTVAETYDLGILYDDTKTFQALFRGRLIRWDMDKRTYGGKYAFVSDLSLTKKVFSRDKSSIDIFVTGHNLTNASQYMFSDWKNPGRWFEGGIRYKF